MTDLSKIPNGQYCYKPREMRQDEPKLTKNGTHIYYVEYCPFYTSKSFGGVAMPWCSFLNQGGYDNRNYSDAELVAVKNSFSNEEAHDDALPLFLLWDACKECGENMGEESGDLA